MDGEARPARIGRFVVLRKLGEGGMGVVYAAYDERARPQGRDQAAAPAVRGAPQTGHARLLREAQAMAQLSHPNVVAVSRRRAVDDGGVFIAMEFVAGRRCGVAGARPRTWREILDVFMQAGRGLAAAHAAGLVHRDFKPESGRFSFRTPSSRETPRISSLEGVGGKIGCPGLTLHAPG